jgi:CheY-like chemotaxis protein
VSLDANSRLKILVVDDEKSVRTSLMRMLNAHGHRAIGAGDGAEAVQKAAEERPDVILMDLLMPGENGIETTRNLRTHAASARIPVIALSASPMRTDDQTLFQVVLSKPCSLADLLRAIHTVVPQKRVSAAE